MAVNIAVLIIIILAVLILSAQSPRWVGRRMLTSATERVAGACSRQKRWVLPRPALDVSLRGPCSPVWP